MNTDFFSRFDGPKGSLRQGYYTFDNNNDDPETNFKNLRMPNEFIFKNEIINAQNFISVNNLIPATANTSSITINTQQKCCWYNPLTWCSCDNSNENIAREYKNTFNIVK